jgi:hypothetical protein
MMRLYIDEYDIYVDYLTSIYRHDIRRREIAKMNLFKPLPVSSQLVMIYETNTVKLNKNRIINGSKSNCWHRLVNNGRFGADPAFFIMPDLRIASMRWNQMLCDIIIKT